MGDAKVTDSVEFIVCEEDGRFVVREEAIQMLNDIQGDISVIALAGLQRTGKSFLMNLLSREDVADGAFVVSPFARFCRPCVRSFAHPFLHDCRSSRS